MNRRYKIFASGFHCKKYKSIMFFRVQPFIWTANCTTLESYFELLCTSLSLVRPPGKIPPSANYTLLFSGIMTLNHNEYKIMNVIGYGTIMIKYQLRLVRIWAGTYSQQDKCLRAWRNFSITGQRLCPLYPRFAYPCTPRTLTQTTTGIQYCFRFPFKTDSFISDQS